MKLKTFNDFTKVADFFYLTIGIEPYRKQETSKRKQILITVAYYLGLINMNYCLVTETLFVVMAIAKGENFVEAVMAMSYVGFVLVGISKILFIRSRKEDLTQFINGLQEIFPNTHELQAEFNTPFYLRQCSRLTQSFTWMYMILIWTYNLFNIMQYLIYDVWLKIRQVEKTLPYFMYVPWNWQNNWSYYLLYVSENFSGYTSAAGHISADLLLTACMTQLLMHFDYTSYKLTSYQVKTCLNEINKDKGYALDLEFLKTIIIYHTNLLDLSDQLNNIFGIPLLFNFATSSFVICFVGFQITIGTTTETVMKLLLFLVSSIAQVYLICYHGQNLIDASTNVAKAVYNQNWTAADVRYKKLLLLIAKRAQKPAVLRATSLIFVSRATMTGLMQISYKFFALLRTVYSN